MSDKSLHFAFDDVRVEPRALKVWKNGSEIPLEPKTFSVLIYLIENRGRLIAKTELLNEVWKGTFVTENAMTSEIAKLRKALGDDPKEARYIQTLHTRGYRFIAVVTEELAGDEKAAEARCTAVARLESTTGEVTPSPKSLLTHDGHIAKFIFRRPFTLALVAVFGAATLAVIAFFIWQNQRAFNFSGPTGRINSALETIQITASTGLDIFPAFSPDGNAIAYSSARGESFEIYVKQLAPGGREIQITSDGGQNSQPAWSPDGKLIAYHSQKRKGLWLIPALGGAARQLTEFGSRPRWSPDGAQIVFQSGGFSDSGLTALSALPPSTIWLVATQGGASPVELTQAGNPGGGHGSPAWSPDGQRIVFIASDTNFTEIWAVAGNGGELKRIVSSRVGFQFDPVFAPDSRSIYFSGTAANSEFNLQRIRVSENGGPSGEPETIVNTGRTLYRHLSLTADGKRLAYSAGTLMTNIWSTPVSPNGEMDGAPSPLTEDTHLRKTFPTFSPDGRTIAYTVWRAGSLPEIWLIDASGSNPRQVRTETFRGNLTDWFGRDSTKIAYYYSRPNGLELRTVTPDGGKDMLVAHLGKDIASPRVSPDASHIVFNSNRSGTVNLWMQSLSGGGARQLTFDKEMMAFPNWSPDGKVIAFQLKRGDDTHLAVIPSEGGNFEQLTFERGQSWTGGWSPDGNKITFAGLRNGYWNVWWVARDGKTQKQVTNFSKINSYVRYPAWSPSGDRIVYEYAETTGNVWVMELK